MTAAVEFLGRGMGVDFTAGWMKSFLCQTATVGLLACPWRAKVESVFRV